MQLPPSEVENVVATCGKKAGSPRTTTPFRTIAIVSASSWRSLRVSVCRPTGLYRWVVELPPGSKVCCGLWWCNVGQWGLVFGKCVVRSSLHKLGKLVGMFSSRIVGC